VVRGEVLYRQHQALDEAVNVFPTEEMYLPYNVNDWRQT
jgi:hypothetical protein